MNYATPDDLNEWLGWQIQDDSQVVAARALTAASKWIDNFCGRTFDLTGTQTRTFAPDNFRVISLGCDLQTLTGITVAGTAWATTDVNLLRSLERFNDDIPYRYVEALGRFFPPWPIGNSRRDYVALTGTWGWASVPDDVAQACIIQAAAIFNRAQSPGGVAGLNEFGVVRVSQNTDPTVMQLLTPYMVSFGIG